MKLKPDWKLDFKRNLSPTHQVIRIIAGIGLLALGVSGLFSPVWTAVLMVLALTQVVEGLVAY